MAGQILSLFARSKNRDWSQQELAEFYRVESALCRSGLSVETDRGLTDEGEPWFVFCRTTDGEVVVHFAKTDGHFVVAGPGYERVSRGRDFSSLVRDLVSRHPLVNTKAREGSNVIMHPTALLIAVVAAALLKNGEAKAQGAEQESKHRDGGLFDSGGSLSTNVHSTSSVTVDARHLAVVLSAIAALVPSDEPQNSVEAAQSHPAISNEQYASSISNSGSAHHAYGVEQFAGNEESSGGYVQRTSDHAPMSPEQKLEIVSLTSVLLDLAVKERPAEASTNQNIALGDLDRESMPMRSEGPAGHNEVLLKIDLVKGSSELPSIQSVAHLSGDQSAIPITLSVLEPYLSHSTHLQSSAHSAIDVLQPLTVNGVIDPGVLASLRIDSSSSSASTSTQQGDSAAQHSAAQDHSDNLPAGGLVNAFQAETVTEAIEHFVHDQGYGVSLFKNDVVFYDRQALSSPIVDLSVRSVTWEFADGSSITLIGRLDHLPAELVA